MLSYNAITKKLHLLYTLSKTFFFSHSNIRYVEKKNRNLLLYYIRLTYIAKLSSIQQNEVLAIYNYRHFGNLSFKRRYLQLLNVRYVCDFLDSRNNIKIYYFHRKSYSCQASDNPWAMPGKVDARGMRSLR